MAAGNLNITVEEGAVFEKVITWKNSDDTVKDLTGYTAKAQLVSTDKTVIYHTSEGNQGTPGGSDEIVFSDEGDGHKMTWTIPSSDTDDFDFQKAKWSLEVTSSAGDTFRVLQGEATLSRRIIQPTT